MEQAFECVIGLEVHVQLLTRTKIFCGCRNEFTHEPNTNVCPVCLGHPGSLPVLNRAVLDLGMKAALAIRCEIPPLTKFDRKHYYYPDLPKNYQISQYDQPLGVGGWLEIDTPEGVRRIGITRAHLEEDAGKLLHSDRFSRVDLNRTGTPLLEIVSEPDLRSPQEAKAFLEQLKLTLRHVGASDCNMEEGSLRCDANISIRPLGQETLGIKNEIKNMNSFRGVESALTQVHRELLRRTREGEPIQQVTWGYNIDSDRIFHMRTKEEANDYRYFPEPDLPPIRIAREQVEAIAATLPERPREREIRFRDAFDLSPADAEILVQDRTLADYFEALAAAANSPKEAANWVIQDLARELRERNLPAEACPVTPRRLAGLMSLVRENRVNLRTGRGILTRMLDGDTREPEAIVEAEGLAQVSDTAPLRDALETAITANPKAVADIEAGKHATAMFFVGQIMQAMKGKADPAAVAEVIAERFGIDPELLRKKKK